MIVVSGGSDPVIRHMVSAVWYTLLCIVVYSLLRPGHSFSSVSKMDRLPPENQEQLRKMSTDRLRLKLGTAGYKDDRLVNLDRAELLEALAEVMLAMLGQDSTQATPEAQEASQAPHTIDETGSITSEAGSEAIRLRELELEEKNAEREERKIAREAEERKAAREAEERKAEREAVARRALLEAEAEERRAARKAQEQKAEREHNLEMEKIKMQLEQAKMLHEMKKIELNARENPLGDNEWDDGCTPCEPRGAGNLALQTKQFGEIMRHVLPKMPQESSELPQFFETVEKLYLLYAVPGGIQAMLLIPLLTDQAKSLVNRMSVDKMRNFDDLKQFLLAEYKLTPREYKTRFENAAKSADETYTLFTARLRNLLSYYLKSRQVADYKTLIELLISDRLKGSLPQGPLNYVLTQEGEGWFIPNKVASLADVFVNNRATMAGPRTTNVKAARVATAVESESQNAQQNQQGSHQSWRGGSGGSHLPNKMERGQCYHCGEFGHIARVCKQIQCYVCDGFGHIARDCMAVGDRESDQEETGGSYRGRSRGSYRRTSMDQSQQSLGEEVHVNLCSTAESFQVRTTQDRGVQADEVGQVTLVNPDEWEFGDFRSLVMCAQVTICRLCVYIHCTL